jgi:hypothetical protein
MGLCGGEGEQQLIFLERQPAYSREEEYVTKKVLSVYLAGPVACGGKTTTFSKRVKA